MGMSGMAKEGVFGTSDTVIVSEHDLAGRLKLAVSTYSYWGFRERKDSIESCILKAAEMEIGRAHV